MRTLIVIPARYASTRLPCKALLDCGGMPLIQRTYEQALKVRNADAYVLAVDSEMASKMPNVLPRHVTPVECRNGTLRCAEVVSSFFPSEFDIIVNWQVDYPTVKPEDVERLIEAASESPITTIVAPCFAKDNDSNVKVAGGNGRCHWFSRALDFSPYYHVGIYAFQARTLLALQNIPQSHFGKAESLEQLDWLVAGNEIRAIETMVLPLSINTQEDLDEYRRTLEAQQ